jgi:hypothetical protein
MRRILMCSLGVFAVCLLLSTGVLAKRNLAEYPLRVHIYQFTAYPFYWGYARSLDFVDGEGRANLFENGQPQGFDFQYRCGEQLRSSPGFESFRARWKKPGKELEILLPRFGRPDSYDSCNLDVLMKSGMAYHRVNGLLSEETASIYKEWMDKSQYDPERDKNLPLTAGKAGASPGAER